MPDKQRSKWREMAWYAPMAIGVGALFELIIGGFQFNIRGLLHGGLIGLFAFGGAVGLEALVDRWVEAASTQWWRRALVYFVGGQIGWVVGVAAGIVLIWGVPISSVKLPRGAVVIAM